MIQSLARLEQDSCCQGSGGGLIVSEWVFLLALLVKVLIYHQTEQKRVWIKFRNELV